MSHYHIYECDRCGKKEKSDTMPAYWAEVKVNDTNHTSDVRYNTEPKFLCTNCGRALRSFLERIPEAVAA